MHFILLHLSSSSTRIEINQHSRKYCGGEKSNINFYIISKKHSRNVAEVTIVVAISDAYDDDDEEQQQQQRHPTKVSRQFTHLGANSSLLYHFAPPPDPFTCLAVAREKTQN